MSNALTNFTFPPRLADLGFSMDVPDGFIEAEIPAGDTDFSDPTQSAPIAILSSPVAVAVIAVAARPAYEDGTVLAWVRYLAAHYTLDLQHVQVKPVGKGDGHPGITAFGVQFQDGMKLHFMMIAFEDGGRLVTAHAMCPAELWPSYGNAMSAAVESITLTSPRGSTHPVDDFEARQHAAQNNRTMAEAQIEMSRASSEADGEPEEDTTALAAKPQPTTDPIQLAIRSAREHLETDAFDDVERAVLSVDSTIQGNVKLMRLYEEHLRALVSQSKSQGTSDKERLERVFYRALSWAQSCYPEPHTQCEADNYEAGRVQDRFDLVTILGYDPDALAKR